MIPDGDNAGEPFVPTLDHRVYLANWYEVKDTAKRGDKNQAFRYRTGLWMAAQKVGKSPGVAAETILEFVGPALFAGRAEEGDYYSCAEHGCPCGGVYLYESGEPMGKAWSTPRIQLAAVVEDQVENTWGALIPMIENGPVANIIPRTGEAFIRHPNGNRDSRIEVVTSKADGKLGARISAGKCDETGLWTESNSMKKFIRTLMRGAGGMGGRVSQSTNPFDPAENSVAQDTYESTRPDVYKHYFPPPEELKFTRKTDRRKIFVWNYASAPWVDLRSIEAEAASLMEATPAEAERFYGNRIVAGSGHWVKEGDWKKKAEPIFVKPRTRICLGFDGSDNNDWTGIRAETLDLYQFTPTYLDGRPTLWRPTDWGGRIPRAEVMAAMDHLASEFEIVRAYCDPMFWESEIDEWSQKYGSDGKVFVKWPTNSIGRAYASLERFRTDITNPDSKFRHDGDQVTRFHIRNAIVRARPGQKYIIGKPAEHQKIDQAMSSMLAHEAASDALAAGAAAPAEENYVYF
ncbi:hypothetical protein D9V32_05490 [Mycetocola tolaasinivorans]|uniref:Terminase n=1 Tax=Mycetocola tolaasinivorans TaxID=76635 RepID=A0A3L7A7Q3_9MICO|nr:hypothetical protein D9V32_05490 [Mycetocola tolaasinivorans]